jgi:hypothetical protein
MQRDKIKITNDESDSIVKLTSKYYDFTEGLKAAQQATEDYMQSMPNGLPPGFKGGVGTGSGAYETEEERQARLGRTIGSGQTRDAFSDLRQHFVDKNSTGMIAGVDAMTQAFSQLGQAVGSAVEAFVLYGNAGASVRQVTAQILASIAQQAAVQAIYELAQGLAVLALAFFGVPNAGPSATAHFAAAAMYGLVAGVTAVAGRGVAGNSMKGGAGGAKGAGAPGSTGAYSYGGTDSINQHPTPYSRASADAYISGHRDPLVAAIDRNTQATLALHKKIDIARPGDVLTRGMDQKPGAVGHQVIKDIGRNAAIGTGMLKAAGQRR